MGGVTGAKRSHDEQMKRVACSIRRPISLISNEPSHRSPLRYYCSRKVDVLCHNSRSFLPSAPGEIASRSRCAVMIFRFRKSRATCCSAYSFTGIYFVAAPLVSWRSLVILHSRRCAATSKIWSRKPHAHGLDGQCPRQAKVAATDFERDETHICHTSNSSGSRSPSNISVSSSTQRTTCTFAHRAGAC